MMKDFYLLFFIRSLLESFFFFFFFHFAFAVGIQEVKAKKKKSKKRGKKRKNMRILSTKERQWSDCAMHVKDYFFWWEIYVLFTYKSRV